MWTNEVLETEIKTELGQLQCGIQVCWGDAMLPERIAPDGVKTWLARYVVSGVQKQTWLPPPHSSGGDEKHMSRAQASADNAQ